MTESESYAPTANDRFVSRADVTKPHDATITNDHSGEAALP
jgi:hypothetical protein